MTKLLKPKRKSNDISKKKTKNASKFVTKVEYQEKYSGMVLKSVISGNIVVTFRLTLSRCLMPSYWKFAFLSKKDVLAILDVMPSRDVWLLGLALGAVGLSPSSFRTAYAHLGDINITSKASVISKILLKFQPMFEQNQQVMLDSSAVSLHHVPALPKFFLKKSEFDKLAATLSTNFQMYNANILKVTSIFTFKEQSNWLAVSFEGDCLHALRVISLHDYQKSKREHNFVIATKMPLIQLQHEDHNSDDRHDDNNDDDGHITDEIYAILCDDGALFGLY